MEYREELLWILDKDMDGKIWDDEINQQRIDFVHSLGLKCDTVGWCKTDLQMPRVQEILDRISAFSGENNWKARCIYERKYVEMESDWFALVPTFFMDNTISNTIEAVAEDGSPIRIMNIRAFHDSTVGPKRWGGNIFVPERFRDCCILNGYELDFCWARDVGKYEAEQYFHAYGRIQVPRVAVDFGLKNSKERIAEAGGWLPAIARVFHELQMVDLEDCFLSQDLPEAGVVYAHIPQTFSSTGRNTILIHKDIAQRLLREKALTPGCLRPAPVFDALPGGYVLEKTRPIPRPKRDFSEKMQLEYEKLKGKQRPVRMVAEKEALKILRRSKRERPGDFQKALLKAKAQELIDTEYGAVLPYYLVANGAILSDEYTLLSYKQAELENEEHQKYLRSEELLEEKPEGVVIGKCPDGDVLVLCKGGMVIRLSHETPEITEQWPSLAQFVVDAINE